MDEIFFATCPDQIGTWQERAEMAVKKVKEPKTEIVSFYGKKQPGEGEMACPYNGVAYNQVPGYRSGYGCPVCGAISFYHLPIPLPEYRETTKEYVLANYLSRPD